MKEKGMLRTWSGSRVSELRWREVLRGWQRFSKKLLRDLTAKAEMPSAQRQSLEFQLCEILQTKLGEIGSPANGEGAVDVLCRIIHERDTALAILARDRLSDAHNARPSPLTIMPRQ